MKYMLIVDIGENQVEDVRINYEVHHFAGDTLAKGYNEKMKPIPSKRESLVKWFGSTLTSNQNTTRVITHEYTEYDKGWNDCVDSFIGEEE